MNGHSVCGNDLMPATAEVITRSARHTVTVSVTFPSPGLRRFPRRMVPPRFRCGDRRPGRFLRISVRVDWSCLPGLGTGQGYLVSRSFIMALASSYVATSLPGAETSNISRRLCGGW
jgi:hypothetical protein